MSLSSYPEVIDAPEFVGVRGVRTTASATWTNLVQVAVPFDSETHDTHGFRDGAVPDRLTVPAGMGGYYHVTANVADDVISATGRRRVSLHKNWTGADTGMFAVAQESNPDATDWVGLSVSGTVFLAPGDTIHVVAYQDSGATHTFGVGCNVDMFYLGPAGGSQLLGPSTLIGHTEYNPSPTSGVGSDYTTTSTTFVEIDAANLSVSFVAPPSGKVLVRLCGLATKPVHTAAANEYFWALYSGTTFVKGSRVTRGIDSSSTRMYMAIPLLITGLTPGTSYTYTWRHRVSGDTYGLMVGGDVVASSARGPAVMEVWRIE